MSNPSQCPTGPASFQPPWGQNSTENARRLSSIWRGALSGLRQWFNEQRQRQDSIAQLRRLDARLLRDIGIDGDDIEGCVDHLLAQQRRREDQWAVLKSTAQLISLHRQSIGLDME